MNLINADRGAAVRESSSTIWVAVHDRPRQAMHDRSRARPTLCLVRVRICLEKDVAITRSDFVFVKRASLHAGEEYVPKPCPGMKPHWMSAPVPVVEIADDAYAAGVWSP